MDGCRGVDIIRANSRELMILSPDTIATYNRSRDCADKSLVCHAPSVNLNFDQYGNVRACCYNYKDILGTWPKQSIKEIWLGKETLQLREYIKGNSLGGGCAECGKMIEAGNHHGVRAISFDEYADSSLTKTVSGLIRNITKEIVYPKVMEFELTNECNLECVMCNGMFSSSIRKNREKLPPILSPYDDRFVDELDEFIPHLTDAKFLGGEPFMMEIYLKIWERIKKINPSVRIHITTNGTILNSRIKSLLEGLKAGIILSIDSLEAQNYSTIRKNGNLERVMANVPYFKDYTARKKTFFSFAVCPMVNNWREIPGILSYCVENNIAMFLNVVFTPLELSLKEMSVAELDEVIAYYLSFNITVDAPHSKRPKDLSKKAFVDFVHLLTGWRKEKSTTAVLAHE